MPVTTIGCGAAATGGHYNPPGHPSQGELSINLGDLSTPTVWEQYVDNTITLWGPESVVGRSVVIHKNDGARWACATIGEMKQLGGTSQDITMDIKAGVLLLKE